MAAPQATNIDKLCQQLAWAKSNRGVWEEHFDDIATFMSPRQIGFSSKPTPGDKRMTKVFDGTGMVSLNLLSAGLHGMATNPSTSWFALGLGDPNLDDDDENKEWLAQTTAIMRRAMYAPGSGITTALNEIYSDLGAFGTAAMFIGERDDGGLLYQARPLSETYISENHEGRVDTVWRCWKEKARNIVEMWPTMASDETKKLAEKTPDEKVEVCHWVGPRKSYDPSKKDRGNMPIGSCYFEVKSKKELQSGGFPEFPYAVPRWNKNAGEDYGRSPGMDALPDVKMLQEMMKTTLKAAQKIIDPPLLIPNDSTVGPIRTTPGGFIYYNGERQIAPLMTNGNIPLSLEMMENLRNRIRTTFYVDVMQFIPEATGKMTATEVLARNQERLRLLGPVVGRIEGELIGPLITRTFGILYRLKMIPEAPRALQGRDLVVNFVSPIAIAQRQTEANSLFQALGFMLPVVESLAAIDPDKAKAMMAPLKTENIWGWVADRYNLDPSLTMSEKEMEEATAADVARQQAQDALAAAGPMADAANKGAGAVDKMASAAEKGADMGGLVDALGSMPAQGNA